MSLSMTVDQLRQGLEQAFKEGHRIVFWYDPEESFTDELPLLDLGAVQILNMDGESALEIKLKLELEDTQGKYLLYFPSAEPEVKKDWLLDIKLYSRCFYADRSSIICNTLGLHQQSLRLHLAKRHKFLASKTRLTTMQRYVQPDFDEVKLDMAMITVVVKAESCDLTQVILALADKTVADDLGLETNPEVLNELEKYDLISALVTALKLEIECPATTEELTEEAPFKLGRFFIRLLLTDFCRSLGDVPAWAQDFVMPSVCSCATTRTLLSRWRDSSKYYKAFNVISGWIATELRIEEQIASFSIDQLSNVMTFEIVEKKIIRDLAEAIPYAPTTELEQLRKMISKRLDGYWASTHQDDLKYQTVYKALQAAIDLFNLRIQYDNGFHFKSCEALYKDYEKNIYRFDMAYRHYCEASQHAHVEILKKLDAAVEKCYAYWYIDNLAKNWGDCIEAEQRLKHWSFPQVSNQQYFYNEQVLPLVAKQRIVVIISDAFRYEAAIELCDRINDKPYSKATLSSQLGVVPSYTTLGMASLLPHKTLEYRDGVSDDVFVDGRSSKGTASRNKILNIHGGMAVTAQTVTDWSRDEGRDALKDQKLVYVYHNVVDARGDNSATESDTFMAVRQAIKELSELSHKILTQFNTSTVIITADHGFLFQLSKLETADRSSLAEKPDGALVLKSKKRYVIGHDLPETTNAWKGSTKTTAGTTSNTDFWIPKGANRFHFVSGSRFVHGGVMPQEIVVPVLTVKQLRGENAKKHTRRKVRVISTKSTLKMTNNIQKFDLMQTEAVSDLITAATLLVAIYDNNRKISSEEKVTFDCNTDSVSERGKQIRLSLAGADFDRKKDYFLILKDESLKTEIGRYPVMIDLAFTDDFF